jgi:multisubunit Na+/H+ antiporter MnhB subunit
MVTDFRGTDTLIEIAVFGMAAMGVLTVLYLTRSGREGQSEQSTSGEAGIISLIGTPLTRYAATLLLPVAAVIALAHLLYAGDAPGDGFTAGVIGGISIALWYQVFGYDRARIRQLRAEKLIGAGMTLAIGNAVLPLLWGRFFLEHNSFGDIPLPAGLHFTSTTIFEIAIFLTVLGSVITIVNAITHPEGIEQL